MDNDQRISKQMTAIQHLLDQVSELSNAGNLSRFDKHKRADLRRRVKRLTQYIEIITTP